MIETEFTIGVHPTPYGDYYISKRVAEDACEYIHHDLSIHSSVGSIPTEKYPGRYKTRQEAERVLNDYYKYQEKNNMRTKITDAVMNDLIYGALEELTDKGDMFTAYDVTTKIRSENPLLDIDHHRVRIYVASVFENGEYFFRGWGRSIVDIGKPEQPYVYYTDNQDPYSYRPTTTAVTASTTIRADVEVIAIVTA